MSETDSLPWMPQEPGTAGFASFRILESYERHAQTERHVETLRHRVSRALNHFPELSGRTVNVGRLDPTINDEDDIGGQAWPKNMLVGFPTDRYASWQTVFHELSHLAIFVLDERSEPVSANSEEFCSIFAVARMPERIARQDDREDIAYLGTPGIEAERWPGVCQRALAYRERRGKQSHYIKRCEEWLAIRNGGEAER